MTPLELNPPQPANQPVTIQKRKKARSPYHQAVELQAILMDASRNKHTTPASLAQVARAWSELEERKRIIKMKPKPKDVDVSASKRRSPPVSVALLSPPCESEDAIGLVSNG